MYGEYPASATTSARPRSYHCCTYTLYNVADLMNALPGNSSVNTVQNATIEETVFSVDPTDVPIDWLDSDHVICLL
jgi:hypothetical protein